MSLTPEQASVIEDPNESKLVVALPGSGKTHTTVSLAERILSMRGTKVLMVTFTNAAANEMRNRISSRLCPADSRRVVTKTFAKIMLDQHQPLLAGRRLVLGGELTTYVLRVFKKLQICISNLQQYQQQFDAYGRDMDWQPKAGNKTCEAYIELLNMLSLYKKVDLNTVAREVVWALREGKIKPLNYSHFIIDEFQDTDSIQYQWLLAHRQEGSFMTVVGDDDQSIYGWRGAVGYQNMLDFKRDFNATPFLLSTCFRCAPYILGTAQRLIEHNDNRLQKDMHSAKTERGIVRVACYEPPSVPKADDDTDLQNVAPAKKMKLTPEQAMQYEYNYVADYIQSDYHTWTILARTNLHLDNLERHLSERGIPALRLGGKSIFDSPNTIAIIKLLHGITHQRKITDLIEGLGWLGECEDALHNMLYTGGVHGFTAVPQGPWLDVTIKLQQLCLRIAQDADTLSRTESYLLSFGSLITNHHEQTSPQDVKSRAGSLKLVLAILMSMKGTIAARAKSLFEIASKGSQRQDAADRAGKVVLCTLTGAKGLEWGRVFLMNINSGTIPSLQPEDTDDQLELKIEEERRLLYVGMTRAEDELVLHYHASKPSMFLIDAGLA
ncbi:ATP-dependent helicase [Rheinheimera sp.]|uniref:ATP-dependent helicase n=1 Tax=Rheinheimera sp. TaxID=1869214 RepID=UPI004047E9BB